MASCPLVYAWADDIQNKDPCEVASSLRKVCDSSLSPLQPINFEDTNPDYSGPSTKLQSPCMCSSIIYVLVSACSDCQSGQIESWPSWSENCVSTSVGSFEGPLPANISIPAWAQDFDVTLNPTYSRSVASSIAATPTPAITNAAAAQILPTMTNTSQTTPTDTPTSTATANFGSDLSSVSTGNRTAAIAGGTIGAVVLLALGAALAYWYMRWRRRTRVPPSVAYMAVHGSGLESSDY